MTRGEKLTKVLLDGGWNVEHKTKNDYGEEVINYRRADKGEEWLQATYRPDAIEIYGNGENSKSVFLHDDPKRETHAERIKRLVDTDPRFVDFVTLLYRVKQDRQDMLNAYSILRRLGVRINSEIEGTLQTCGRKKETADRALEDMYGVSWHHHEMAFAACGLE